MRILLSNDDGVHAPGIHALAAEFSKFADVVIVAPERERSTTGHYLTLHKPLRLHKYSPKIYAVSGGPADCICVALNEVMKKPDLVISGINKGSNLGQDVFYSGTVSAAREAANNGIPAIAVSLNLDKPHKEIRYRDAAKATRKVLESLPGFAQSWRAGLKAWPHAVVFNVNVPNLPWRKIKGYRAAVQGTRIYSSEVVKREDHRGRDYFWIGGKYQGYKPIPESDCWMVDRGYVSITPLELDTSDKDAYALVSGTFCN